MGKGEAANEHPGSPGLAQITDRQRTAIDLILMGKTPTQIGREGGIPRRTLWDWRQDPAFQQALEEARQERFNAGTERMKRLHEVALARLLERLGLDEVTEGKDGQLIFVGISDQTLAALVRDLSDRIGYPKSQSIELDDKRDPGPALPAEVPLGVLEKAAVGDE